MREIKFRVWHKETLTLDGMPDTERMSSFRWTPSDLMEAAIRTQSVLGEDKFLFLQFTGLLDKNGVEIYEGDILKLDSWEGLQVICFIEGAFCLANKNEDYLGDIHYIQHGGTPQATVMGNVYENPELLKP